MYKNLDKKELGLIFKKLEKLGLGERESIVYLNLLSRSSETGTTKVINATKLHGQYVYQALASLEAKGLIKHVVKNGRKKFSANSPERLETLVQEKHVIAHELRDKLEKVFSQQYEQEFEVYQGEDQFVAHEFKMVQDAAPGDFVYLIGGLGRKFPEIMGSNREDFNTKSASKKIATRFIGPESQREYLEFVKSKRPNFNFRIMKGFMETLTTTAIRPKSITLQIYGNPVLVFTVKNPEVAQSYKNFFEALWNMCEPTI